MAKLLYQGHGSFRLISQDGVVVYIDPFMGTGYEVPADLILTTHQHDDHTQISLITQKPDCTLIQSYDAIVDGVHQKFTIKGVEVEAVEAGYNAMHDAKDCVGYIITIDGLSLYFLGDTSETPTMATLKDRNLDYAFLCGDGFYNMNLEEAARCAELIGAKHNVPVHLKPGEIFDREMAETFNAPNRLIIEGGAEVEL